MFIYNYFNPLKHMYIYCFYECMIELQIFNQKQNNLMYETRNIDLTQPEIPNKMLKLFSCGCSVKQEQIQAIQILHVLTVPQQLYYRDRSLQIYQGVKNIQALVYWSMSEPEVSTALCRTQSYKVSNSKQNPKRSSNYPN